MRASGSTTASASLPSVQAPPLTRFHLESGREVRPMNTGGPLSEKGFETAGAAPTEVSFGPFRLRPTQFLLMEGDKPVPLGSRALEILTVLLERPGHLVSKQELMARVWPNIFVDPANLTVHMSALRRVLRDGRDGNRFIINIPGRGYCFVAPIEASFVPRGNLVSVAGRRWSPPVAAFVEAVRRHPLPSASVAPNRRETRRRSAAAA